jgi:hypothetical protein
MTGALLSGAACAPQTAKPKKPMAPNDIVSRFIVFLLDSIEEELTR